MGTAPTERQSDAMPDPGRLAASIHAAGQRVDSLTPSITDSKGNEHGDGTGR